jgi:hypothetical protein
MGPSDEEITDFSGINQGSNDVTTGLLAELDNFDVRDAFSGGSTADGGTRAFPDGTCTADTWASATHSAAAVAVRSGRLAGERRDW